MKGLARFATVRNFLRVLGAIYGIAFLSFGAQAAGLIGSHGILPVADFLQAVRDSLGPRAAQEVPTVLWASASDAALAAVWILGLAAALAAVFSPWPRVALAVCLVLWLSLCAAGQDFLSFQWDVLLLEAGFLALFADARPVRVWLFRWLLFRLMFFSGMVKLLSHDASWSNLTALQYHYWTQPLPTPAAWWMEQLPPWFQKLSTALVLACELPAPFLFLAPWRTVRLAGAWITIALQVLILVTGNYAFFNFLTIALAMWLFLEPDRSPTTRGHRAVSAALAGFIAFFSALLLLELFGTPLPEPGAAVMRALAPFRVVNSYGLFAVMTTTRPEIVVEGSYDGDTWQGYEFRYKPGDVRRAPPVVAPFQPRLDWQMWFAALGNYRENRWFVNFVVRLLQGEPAVLRLLAYNPFPGKPPKFVRASLYEYRFTRSGEAGWWRRERKGLYFPPVALK
jgi:lipase maturation factor 1